MGPLLSGDSVLVVVDCFSRYHEIDIMCYTTSAEIIKSLERSGDSVLVVVDCFSRYHEIDIMCYTTSAEIIKSLERIFMIHGLPLSVTSDNGPLKDIWRAVVSNTRKPYHYDPKQN